jgi:hypothetical protein
MEPLFARILKARRKRLFGSKAVFEPYKPASDIPNVEARIGISLPEALSAWLAAASYGDINQVLSFRSDWFNVIDRGELKGHVVFAQDILGNSYSFSPADGTIHFICRSAPEYAFLSRHFAAFIEELERRDFQLEEWTDSLTPQRYEWGT